MCNQMYDPVENNSKKSSSDLKCWLGIFSTNSSFVLLFKIEENLHRMANDAVDDGVSCITNDIWACNDSIQTSGVDLDRLHHFAIPIVVSCVPASLMAVTANT